MKYLSSLLLILRKFKKKFGPCKTLLDTLLAQRKCPRQTQAYSHLTKHCKEVYYYVYIPEIRTPIDSLLSFLLPSSWSDLSSVTE